MATKTQKNELPPVYGANMFCTFLLTSIEQLQGEKQKIYGGKVVPYNNFNSKQELELYVKYYCMAYGMHHAEAITLDTPVSVAHQQLLKNTKDFFNTTQEKNESNTQIQS